MESEEEGLEAGGIHPGLLPLPARTAPSMSSLGQEPVLRPRVTGILPARML
jgi:hypothetical protein